MTKKKEEPIVISGQFMLYIPDESDEDTVKTPKDINPKPKKGKKKGKKTNAEHT